MKLLRKLFVLFFIALSGCIHAPVTQQISEIPQKVTTFKNTVVSLTFDDGAADNYDVRPILSQNKLHATFYISSGLTGTDGYMTGEQLRGLYEDGNEIGGHTLNHVKLTEISGDDLKKEICQNRTDLMNYSLPYMSWYLWQAKKEDGLKV